MRTLFLVLYCTWSTTWEKPSIYALPDLDLKPVHAFASGQVKVESGLFRSGKIWRYELKECVAGCTTPLRVHAYTSDDAV